MPFSRVRGPGSESNEIMKLTLTALSTDPYRNDELDPLKTQAIDSSLWEIAALRSHYLASVSTLAKIFGEAFTKPSYDLEDFMDHAYSTVCLTIIPRGLIRWLTNVYLPSCSRRKRAGKLRKRQLPT